jgi:predicted ribosome quality control (RQC) complex YloA/Tae2 family protein
METPFKKDLRCTFRCLGKVQTILKRLKQREAEFAQQLESAEQGEADELQKRGDMITAYTHTYTKGEKCLRTYDFETGEEVLIE